MKQFASFIVTFLLMVASAVEGFGQEMDWKSVWMDGSRTGCEWPGMDNVEETIGKFEKGKFVSPNGRQFKKCSATAKVAKVVLEAQPKMARVKKVIGYSPRVMTTDYPESALSNWAVDIIKNKTEELAGKKVDIAITNFGGIRIDMPEGDIILDDMLSMFPFKNHLVYIEQTGKQIRAILEGMAARRFQVLGGVRVVANEGKLESVEIGGEPLDDDKIYGLATISFLLGGGDGLALEYNALSVTPFPEVDVIDAVLEYVYAETAAGRPLEYQTDGRVVIKDLKERR